GPGPAAGVARRAAAPERLPLPRRRVADRDADALHGHHAALGRGAPRWRGGGGVARRPDPRRGRRRHGVAPRHVPARGRRDRVDHRHRLRRAGSGAAHDERVRRPAAARREGTVALMTQSFDLPDVERLVVGTVGEPGQRVFYLQARQGRQIVTLKVEKAHVAELSARLIALLIDGPEEDAGANLALEAPTEPDFVVGSLA